MFDEEVKIISFPFMDLFGDFRVFNGIQLIVMDVKLGKLKETLIEIANIHASNEREEKLKRESIIK
jgi:hypothetical protein